VPIAIADRVLELAYLVDSGISLVTEDTRDAIVTPDPDIRDAIAAIVTKIQAKEKGYQFNNATRLIKDLRSLNSE
jgi:hypothetical protein